MTAAIETLNSITVTRAAFEVRALFRNERVLFVLIFLNMASYFFGVCLGLWSAPIVVTLVVIYAICLNQRYLLAGYMCWPNIFVALLALFHLGYYLPAKLGLVDEIGYLPVNNTESEIAILLFVAAVLAFEAGVLSGCRRVWSWKRVLRERAQGDAIDSASVLLKIGIPTTAIAALLLFVFVIQQGGLRNLLQVSYVDFNDFLTANDSRFVETGIQFFPLGILTTYAGLIMGGSGRRSLIFTYLSSSVFILWLLLIGSRGTALLFLLAILYIGHICGKRVPWQKMLLVATLVMAAIPIIAAYRNVNSDDRVEAIQDAKASPLAAAVEMGQTYRTLVGFVSYFWTDHVPLMLGKPYLTALPRLLPNLGFTKGEVPTGEFYRSNVWITQMLDPAIADVGGGLGSTGIGEPYANFGYVGVIGFFWLLGILIGGLEQLFMATHFYVLVAVICGLFGPINWYIRDDIYGTLRPVVWSFIPILFFLLRFTQER